MKIKITSGSDSPNLFQAAIGNRSREYFLRKFDRYVRDGISWIDFNPWALVFGFFWFLYRRILSVGGPALLAYLLIRLLAPDELQREIILYWLAVGSSLGCLFGNQLYFIWIVALIRNGRLNGKVGDELVRFLQREGGTIENMKLGDVFKR